jgi:hypothetical protein
MIESVNRPTSYQRQVSPPSTPELDKYGHYNILTYVLFEVYFENLVFSHFLPTLTVILTGKRTLDKVVSRNLVPQPFLFKRIQLTHLLWVSPLPYVLFTS